MPGFIIPTEMEVCIAYFLINLKVSLKKYSGLCAYCFLNIFNLFMLFFSLNTLSFKYDIQSPNFSM